MSNKHIPASTLLALALALATLAGGSAATAQEHGHEHKAAKVDLSKLPPASTKANVTYEADIKPIFEDSCVKCHGMERPKAKLQLTSLAGALKGSKEGKVIVPGQSTKSPLVIAVAQISEDDEEWMPPLHNKAKIGPLTKDQVGLIRAWVDQGAK